MSLQTNISISWIGESKFKRFIKKHPDAGILIAGSLADAFAKRLKFSIKSQHLPHDAALSTMARRSSRGGHPFIVRPGMFVPGSLNFLAQFESGGINSLGRRMPHRPFFDPAVKQFQAGEGKRVIKKSYDNFVKEMLA